MTNFLKKTIKPTATVYLTAITALLCIILNGMQSFADVLVPAQKAGAVLVVPANSNLIRFALELAETRGIALVSFRNQRNTSSLLIYFLEKNGWRQISRETFAALKFISGSPDAAVVIGDDQVVPKELLQSMDWPCKIERIQSVLIADLVNGLDKYFHFSSRERQKFEQTYDLTPSQLIAPSSPSAPTNALPRTDKDRQDEINPVPAEKINDENIHVQEKKAERGAPEGNLPATPRPPAAGLQAGPQGVPAKDGEDGKSMPGKDIRLILSEDVNMVFIWLESLSIRVGRDEVTNAQYNRFDRAHNLKKYYDHVINLPDQPAVQVSWEDANNYCGWLNRNYHAQLPTGCEFRLPSEKEWMAFALCGREKEYPWGNQWPPPNSYNYKGTEGANIIYKFFQNEKFIHNHTDGFILTAPVGKSGTNEWGLYGVGGNVWEWSQDWFDETKTTRVLKGGAWNNSDPVFLSVTNRGDAMPEKSNTMIGFRVVIAPKRK